MSFITPAARQASAGTSAFDGIFSFGGGLALLTLSVLLILGAALLREWYHPAAERSLSAQKAALLERGTAPALDVPPLDRA